MPPNVNVPDSEYGVPKNIPATPMIGMHTRGKRGYKWSISAHDPCKTQSQSGSQNQSQSQRQNVSQSRSQRQSQSQRGV